MGNNDRRVARIWKAIDEILWKTWDPLGVNETEAARDEYDGYIGGVFHLLEAGASAEHIAEHLHHIEVESMSIAGSLSHCREVAKSLLLVNLAE